MSALRLFLQNSGQPVSLRRLLLDPLLLVYQLPKTGSQTVEATLQHSLRPHLIFRTHFLSAEIASTTRRLLNSTNQNGAWRRNTELQLAVRDGLWKVVRARMILRRCGLPIRKLEVITAVREPISLALSNLFENYAHFIGQVNENPAEACRRELLKPRDQRFIWQWFERELKGVLGLDIYRWPFPHRKGYDICENRLARVLVYRFDKLAMLPAMLHEFLGGDIRQTVSRNIGRKKPYGNLYREASERLRLPRDFVRAQCHCRMMRHFYTEEERHGFEERWSDTAMPQLQPPRRHAPNGCPLQTDSEGEFSSQLSI